MTTAGSAGTPRVSVGPFVPPPFGRPSTPPATYLWLMIAILHEWALARAITWIAVTRRRFQAAGAVLPTTLRITGTLAAVSAAPGKVLVNALRAVRRAVDNLTQAPGTSTTTAPPGALNSRTQGPFPDRTPQTNPGTGPGHRILAHNLVKSPAQPKNQAPKINNSAGPGKLPTANTSETADFFRSK